MLFGDLLDWNNWFHRAQRLSPLNITLLGSEEGVMQDARFESGLDNSPTIRGQMFCRWEDAIYDMNGVHAHDGFTCSCSSWPINWQTQMPAFYRCVALHVETDRDLSLERAQVFCQSRMNTSGTHVSPTAQHANWGRQTQESLEWSMSG